uniref:Uncharacterized protein n=1 Tax=Rhizophora mucronata TaxID=61149 RepID=A0A2P2MG91_RHIMU
MCSIYQSNSTDLFNLSIYELSIKRSIVCRVILSSMVNSINSMKA